MKGYPFTKKTTFFVRNYILSLMIAFFDAKRHDFVSKAY